MRAACLSLCLVASLSLTAVLVPHVLRYPLLSFLLEFCVGKRLESFCIALHVSLVSIFFVVTVGIIRHSLKLPRSDSDS